MSLLKLLLRALVCVALIVNGSGFAVAGTQMPMQHAPAGMMDAMPASLNAHTGCMESTTAATKTNKSSAHVESGPATMDCCDEAACCSGSVCPSTIHGFQISPQALDAVPVLAEHSAPILWNRYRPPIA